MVLCFIYLFLFFIHNVNSICIDASVLKEHLFVCYFIIKTLAYVTEFTYLQKEITRESNFVYSFFGARERIKRQDPIDFCRVSLTSS